MKTDLGLRQSQLAAAFMLIQCLVVIALALMAADTPAQNQSASQPPGAPKPSEGGSILNSPSAIAQRATADQLSSTNRVLELDGHGAYVELPPNSFSSCEPNAGSGQKRVGGTASEAVERVGGRRLPDPGNPIRVQKVVGADHWEIFDQSLCSQKPVEPEESIRIQQQGHWVYGAKSSHGSSHPSWKMILPLALPNCRLSFAGAWAEVNRATGFWPRSIMISSPGTSLSINSASRRCASASSTVCINRKMALARGSCKLENPAGGAVI